jgi:uncharacterized protein (DUF1015 family)
MEPTAPVAPPYVVKPFSLAPFPALMLSSSGVGDPASSRVFARPYHSVPGRLRHWQQSGRIHQDDVPAVYLHEYTAGGVTVRGLVGLLDLARTSHTCPDAQQAVFPHEGVHREQVDELAHRMYSMRFNPAPILLVHRGPQSTRSLIHRVLQGAPELSFTDRAGQLHRVWALRNSEVLKELDSGLSDARALIADGHHRYAAYLRLRHEHPATAWDHGLAMLVDQTDTPLWLGPIHRFVADLDLDHVVDLCAHRPDFSCHIVTRTQALAQLGEHTLVLTDDSSWATLTLPAGDALAVTTLETVLLPHLGVEKSAISFHHTAESGLLQARSRRGTCILMPIPSFDAVAMTAGHGILLPEKATSFQPKPSLGVLMRALLDE